MGFLSELYLKDLGNGSFSLTSSLRYESKCVENRIVIQSGFVTDMATVPWFGRIFVPKIGPYNKAIVLHDWVINNMGWKQSTEILCESLDSLKVKRWRKFLICFFVEFYRIVWRKK